MLKRKKDIKSRILIFGSFFLILSGIFIIGSNYYDIKKLKQTEEEKVETFFVEDIEEDSEVTDEIVEEPTENKTEKTIVDYDYIAVLEIPSIGLKRGLVEYGSKYNDVKYNIQIIEKSKMPDIENGNLILAGHNGNSYVSFFRNLYKIKDNDLINVYYNGYKYIYKFSNSYEDAKTGTINIVRDNNKNTITLITCKKNSNDKQLVFIGYLVDKVSY